MQENDDFLAFFDINPQAPVHVLVIPKKHHDNIGALARSDSDLTGRLAAFAAEVAENQEITDYRLVFNTGAGAGQSVFHVHGHVLGGRDLEWPPG